MRKKTGSLPRGTISNHLKLWNILMIVSAILIPSIAEPQRKQPENCVGGTLSAPIKLEVYSDFQCPTCAKFFLEVVMPAVEEYGRSGKICVLYNEFPLPGHQYSHKAASYALAAQRIGHNQWLTLMETLYRSQPIWTLDGEIDKMLSATISSGDLARIRKIAGESSIRDAVDREVDLGLKREVHSTPTVFVTVRKKTQKIEQFLPYEVWKDFFEDNLK